MKRLRIAIVSCLLLMTGSLFAAQQARHTFSIQNGNFLYDGKPIQIHSGEMHYERVPAPYWRHRLKMMKAMGLNAVATYVFWNYHEVAPGKWDWKTGNRNIRGFIKACQEEGMMVILRPGPYGCGEWEFGGYPWWLQKTKGLVIRTDNQQFLDSCRTYINQLAGQVRDLQITKGGPIVMVQVENEFGSYVAQRKDIPLEVHKSYSAKIRQMLLDAGFNINTFTSDGSWLFKGGSIEGALPTANGEDNIENLKKVVNEYHHGVGPYMVAEFYPGWLDHWNEPFQKVSTQTVVKQAKKYLEAGINFNIYMVHGGTNFGFTSGANYSNAKNIQPDLTSYDYDAPISEAGWNTPKYDSLRALMMKYVKYKVPAVPARIPVIALPHITLNKTVDLFQIIDKMQAVENDKPMTFEDLNQGYGYVLYRRHFNQPISGIMRVPGIADYGIVYVNGEKVGELNRLTGKDSLEVNVPFNGTLDILVENCGRINYGARITENLKGITQPITIEGNEITGNWQMYQLPMDKMPDTKTLPVGYQAGKPVLYSGNFTVNQVGDTFLDMEKWGKGIVFVNGINLGRYWKVGPQQTLYLPGCFLKKGENDIVIFEQQNDTKKSEVAGVTQPVLDKLVKE
ncbi:MAG: beta-galactosidase [Prevotella sp.]|nr:beta-galactosidase [Prevotella sp.]MCI2079445.1 beta-galactosidase [Prevotella sp.]MCI2101295.1 beta-galactosidase [Prevotella sp.]